MRFLSGFIFAFVVAALAGFVLLKQGIYPVNADVEPNKIEAWIAEMALESHVEKQSKDLKNPFNTSEDVLAAGLKAYQKNCVGCHGSATNKDATFANSLYPKAPQFADRNTHMSDTEIFWVTKHGIRMSGMPAFGSMLKDDDMWKISAFLHRLDNLPTSIKSQWLSGK